MANPTGLVIESQVDYLTVSAHSEDRSRALSDLADDLLTGEIAAGNQRTGWRSMGYLGFHAGHIDWGRRDERQAILRVSGGPADSLLLSALAVSDNVSRLDVATTWRCNPPNGDLGADAYTSAYQHFTEHPRAAEPGVRLNARGGYTLYMGDQRSPHWGRLYNKEAERESRQDGELARHYRACWRYEVEAHDERAKALAAAVVAATDRPAWVQQWLHDWWAAHGVPPAFPPSGAVALVEGFHRHTDDETRLRHLKRNVAPTVKKLAAHGKMPMVRDALGLDTGEAMIRSLALLLGRDGGTIPLSGPQTSPPKGDHGNA